MKEVSGGPVHEMYDCLNNNIDIRSVNYELFN